MECSFITRWLSLSQLLFNARIRNLWCTRWEPFVGGKQPRREIPAPRRGRMRGSPHASDRPSAPPFKAGLLRNASSGPRPELYFRPVDQTWHFLLASVRDDAWAGKTRSGAGWFAIEAESRPGPRAPGGPTALHAGGYGARFWARLPALPPQWPALVVGSTYPELSFE